MKTQQSFNLILFVTLLAGWIPISQALDVEIHADVSMFNIQINPSAGSINWLTNWEIDSTASAFESSAGFNSAYDEDIDGDGETNASAASTIDNTASSDASTNTLTLNANSDTEIADANNVFITNFSASTLYREFEITGGSGNVNVEFFYEYLAQLMGEAVADRHFSVDYTVILEVSDGTNTWNITSHDQIGGTNTSITENYGGVKSDTFTLKFGTPYYVILNVDPEYPRNIPPICELIAFHSGPPASIEVLAQDKDNGLQSIVTLVAINVNVDIPGFPIGTTDPVMITATQVDPSKGSFVEFKITDVKGSVTTCDPVITLVVRENGKPVSETYTNIPEEESNVTVRNGYPGIKNLDIIVNGDKYKVTGLGDNQEITIDISDSMVEGYNNTITLTAKGKPDASAIVVISD